MGAFINLVYCIFYKSINKSKTAIYSRSFRQSPFDLVTLTRAKSIIDGGAQPRKGWR